MADYLLGGKDNFAADREVVDRAVRIAPELPTLAWQGRGFLRRVVRYMARAGIRQFVDIGCGLPTQGYVHEVALAENPDARVVYVDNDPVVVSHACALLDNHERTSVVQADMCEPKEVLAHPEARRLLDLTEPVGVLLVGVLSTVLEDDVARRIVSGFTGEVCSGSHLALSHMISDVRPDVTARLAALYREERILHSTRRRNLRTRAEVEPYFDGLDLVAPGLVPLPLWRPDPGDGDGPARAAASEAAWAIGGVGRKP